MKHSPRTLCVLAAVACGSLCALEPELRLGPDELVLGLTGESKHISGGKEFLDSAAVAFSAAGRYNNFGLTLKTATAIEEDKKYLVDSGETVDVTYRLDYLVEESKNEEIGMGFQVLPHFESTLRPDRGLGRVDEPKWLGVDGWLMLPFEGVELGGSLNADVGKNFGWYGTIGSRQMRQYKRNGLDILCYEMINFGTPDYQTYIAGRPNHTPPANRVKTWDSLSVYEQSGGLTSFDLGIIARMGNLPVSGLYITMGAEAIFSLGSVRSSVEDKNQVILSVGVEYRFGEP
jgi:hypothetical protein